MAAAFLERARGRGGLVVASAGLLPGGMSPPPGLLAAMAPYGLDLGGHLSRQLTAEMVVPADLVLGMGRRHVQEAVLLDPSAWTRAFTLKELVRRGRAVGPRPDGVGLRAWAALVHEGRSRSDLVGRDGADEVADPFGGPAEGYQRTAQELADLVRRLVDLVRVGAPEGPPRPAPVPELDDPDAFGEPAAERH